MNKNKYIYAGAENEKHYGWGCEDYDRYERFKVLDYRIYRYPMALLHLGHLRTNNSFFRDLVSRNISVSERYRTQNSSKEELYCLAKCE